METKNATILSILEKYVTPTFDQKIVEDLTELWKKQAISETTSKYIRALLEITHCQRSTEIIQEFKKEIDINHPVQHELDILQVSLDQWYEKHLQQYTTHLSNIRSLAKL